MPAPDPTQKTMLQHALEYLELGYPVFPVCSPLMGAHQHRIDGKIKDCPPDRRGKNPMRPWKEFQDTLPTPQEVRGWWTRWPNANIGMATGHLSGVIVLDCDSGDAQRSALARGGLEKAPAVWTGKPGAIHFWLAHPGRPVKNFVREIPGTDFRGDGGYVLLPPSVHANHGAKYRWHELTVGNSPPASPSWLDDLLQEKSARASAPGEFNPDDAIDADEALRGFDEGERDTRLFSFAGWLRHYDYPPSVAEALIAEAARNCRPPFDEDAAIDKVRRAYREYEPGGEGPTIDGLDGDDWGFSPPEHEGLDAGDWFKASASDAATGTPPAVFLRPISELLAMPEVDPDWLVQDLFTVGSNGWVAAEPKVGKSWIVLELAYALSTGTPFLGRFAVKQPRTVIYVQEEDSADRVNRRLKKIIKGDPSRGIPQDDRWLWSIRVGFKLDNLTWLETLRQEIIRYKGEVIILDVFNRLHGSDENKQAEMSTILGNLNRLSNDYGCAFIIVHHNRKPQQGNEARGNQMIRGSGVLAGWAECSLYLRKSTKQHTFIVTPESKDAPEIDDFTVMLQDLDNGGVILEMGSVSPQERSSKLDSDILAAVEKIGKQGMDATVQRIADALGRERSGIQKRMKGLVEEGFLDEDEAQIGRTYTKIYSVVTK